MDSSNKNIHLPFNEKQKQSKWHFFFNSFVKEIFFNFTWKFNISQYVCLSYCHLPEEFFSRQLILFTRTDKSSHSVRKWSHYAQNCSPHTKKASTSEKAQADVRTKAVLLLCSYQKSFQRLQKGLKALLMITQAWPN